MTRPRQTRGPDHGPCPKRLWVMLALTEDEDLVDLGQVPRGLSFHLARCMDCREAANRLLSVNQEILRLKENSVEPRLLGLANERALAALASGAILTGRSLASDDVFEPEASTSVRVRYLRRIAIAACFFVVLVWGGWNFLGSGDLPTWTGITGRLPLNNSQGHRDAAQDLSGPIEEGLGTKNPKSNAEALAQGTLPPKAICRNVSRYDAATVDNLNCVPPAFPFPQAGTGDGGTETWFDKGQPVGSNRP